MIVPSSKHLWLWYCSLHTVQLKPPASLRRVNFPVAPQFAHFVIVRISPHLGHTASIAPIFGDEEQEQPPINAITAMTGMIRIWRSLIACPPPAPKTIRDSVAFAVPHATHHACSADQSDSRPDSRLLIAAVPLVAVSCLDSSNKKGTNPIMYPQGPARNPREHTS